MSETFVVTMVNDDLTADRKRARKLVVDGATPAGAISRALARIQRELPLVASTLRVVAVRPADADEVAAGRPLR